MFRLLTRSYATRAVKPSNYGQPVFKTHPHLLARGEITPGFTAEEYESRRAKLMESLDDGAIVISVSAPMKYMSGEIFYQYRQASDFWYLTGFEEPNSAVVLVKDPSTKRGYRMTLFCSGTLRDRERWDGAKTSLRLAIDAFGPDDALQTKELGKFVRGFTTGGYTPSLYVDFPHPLAEKRFIHRFRQKQTASAVQQLFLPQLSCSLNAEQVNEKQAVNLWDLYAEVGIDPTTMQRLGPEIAKLRVIKSEAEQAAMKAANDISARAHAKTMRFTEPGMSESVVAAHFEYLCKREGAKRLAYVPVVASGANGMIIHYTANDHKIDKGDMLLIDAGCEYNGYASDITRTYPAKGTFTSPQRDLYQAVLNAQKNLIALCSESSSMTLWDLHNRSYEELKTELKQININVRHEKDMMELYPHMLSHTIGIDLHETQFYDRSHTLKAGNVITVEPGIYVPAVSRYPSHFHEMAVRIEDVVLIGEKNPVILSANAPKEVVDVEAACTGSIGLEPF
ncbi:peptidase M24 [Mycena floridula]|nr:peptidase M24 [Mycena floridula]